LTLQISSLLSILRCETITSNLEISNASKVPFSPWSTSIPAPPRLYCSMATLQVMEHGSLSDNEAELVSVSNKNDYYMYSMFWIVKVYTEDLPAKLLILLDPLLLRLSRKSI
ncbi:unnamed protein product, partial [Thlaspi arvense]